jgi:hypothetical protein
MSLLLLLSSLTGALGTFPLCTTAYPGYTDIRTVPADLVVPNTAPNISFAPPAPGVRVLARLPGWVPTPPSTAQDYFMLYLPTDWQPDGAARYPILLELPGNGPYTSPWGDASSGRPEDTYLGFGIAQGRQAIWAALPFLTAQGRFPQTYWWGCPENGDRPCSATPANNSQGCISAAQPPCFTPPPQGCLAQTDTAASRRYLRQAVAHLVAAYRGDASRVVLAGFSRGAIGVNYVGLGDSETAALWAGSIAYAHYDGQPEDLHWPYPNNTPAAAYARLQRLGSRPHFVCSELNSTLSQTRPFIEGAGFPVNATYAPTGFCNHNSQWVLRPSAAREQLRAWWRSVVGSE